MTEFSLNVNYAKLYTERRSDLCYLEELEKCLGKVRKVFGKTFRNDWENSDEFSQSFFDLKMRVCISLITRVLGEPVCGGSDL